MNNEHDSPPRLMRPEVMHDITRLVPELAELLGIPLEEVMHA